MQTEPCGSVRTVEFWLGITVRDSEQVAYPWHRLRTQLAELNGIREQQVGIFNSVTFYSDKVSDSEEKLNTMNEWIRNTDKLIKENLKLKQQVSALESKLNEKTRLNNIEIQGIPEKENENLNNIVQKIGRYVGCDIGIDKIEYVIRVQMNKNSKNTTENIIARFVSRRDKENFLAAAKKKR
ncbi:hypothetical protein HHI36_010191 [Cryptolaemus montrouzieri]|uniref:Uncharacterized protein n=1 Tax=Cryptolaemus montrouzieri TaxID=559131 RepID=A0ABD2MI20_9CUCU